MLLFNVRIGAIFGLLIFFFPSSVNESSITKYSHRKWMCRNSTCLHILAETETHLTKVGIDYYCYYHYYYYYYHHHHYHRPTGCCPKIKFYLQEVSFRALHCYYPLSSTHAFLML